MMSDEMSERATDIAESTVMNDESMQALSMMQIRYLSERMTDGWRIGGGRAWRIRRFMLTHALHHQSMPSHAFENTYIPESQFVEAEDYLRTV
jgi:hypothetical protein